MREEIIAYLVDQMSKTMIGYEVNGTPEKRLFRLRSLAKQQYAELTKQQKQLIINKINKN